MPLRLPPPIIYLITKGATNAHTTSASEEFASVLELVSAAVAANVSLIQIREKDLTARVFQELVKPPHHDLFGSGRPAAGLEVIALESPVSWNIKITRPEEVEDLMLVLGYQWA